MRTLALWLAAITFCWTLAWAAPAQRRFPRGLRDAARRNRPTDVPSPPRRRSAEPAQLRREAEELAQLAQSIPLEIEQVSKGLLPKDLNAKLKRIQKLSKRLRSEISH